MLSVQEQLDHYKSVSQGLSVSQVFSDLYALMMKAAQASEHDAADEAKKLIERTRQELSMSPTQGILKGKLPQELPYFAQQVLGKSSVDLGREEKSNCINAALNFSAEKFRFEPYSPIELFDILQAYYFQIHTPQSLKFGDLIVAWSRDSKQARLPQILLSDLRKTDPAFPHGLIFDHVMVYLTKDIVFHKPDPTNVSRYQLDLLEAALLPTQSLFGFELTYHRKF